MYAQRHKLPVSSGIEISGRDMPVSLFLRLRCLVWQGKLDFYQIHTYAKAEGDHYDNVGPFYHSGVSVRVHQRPTCEFEPSNEAPKSSVRILVDANYPGVN